MNVLADEKLYNIEICEKTGKVLALIWKDTTANMKDEDFKNTLVHFSNLAVENQTPYLLIDTRNWKHQFEDVGATMQWRTQNIIPRYKEAGAVKEAFFSPENAPKIQADYGELITDTFHTKERIENWFFQ